MIWCQFRTNHNINLVFITWPFETVTFAASCSFGGSGSLSTITKRLASNIPNVCSCIDYTKLSDRYQITTFKID